MACLGRRQKSELDVVPAVRRLLANRGDRVLQFSPKHLCRERLTEQAGHLSRRIDGGVFIAISLGERSVNRSFSCLFMLSVFSTLSTVKKKSKTFFLFVLEVFQELF